LVHRRLWREKCRGLKLFLRAARADAAECQGPEALSALRCLDLLENAAASLSGWDGAPREAEAGATAFLQLAILAATAWIAVRLAALAGSDDASRRLAGSARYWLSDLAARAELQHALAVIGASRLSLIEEILPPPK
ncbi:MAG: acyl-CoA dehydrogenase, partial [Pseudomonadota bacterium]|nr:acyl-CoA dehydrogenase [Pseudomonadota bacterium]